MSLVDKSDIINCKSWMSLADCNYELDFSGDEVPDSCVVYCNIEHVQRFFNACKNTDNKYVLISGFSDFGLAHQKEHPVSADMLKWIPFIESDISNSLGYDSLKIGPRCDIDKCNIDDKYSVKCYSFTHSTFNEIPKNIIKWFVVNPMIMKNNIQGIPIGVGKDSPDVIAATEVPPYKANWLYINWQNYTTERVHLKQYFENNNWDWATIHSAPDRTLEEYYTDLARHKFVVCPPGNGIDCYRILEAIYLGCIPIMEKSPVSKYFSGLPIITIDHWGQIDSLDTIKSMYEHIDNNPSHNFLEKVKLSFWKSQIRESLNEVS
tara:strand:+ start:6766 stop:7728 length:963 start_codon:yes stop_codon:yes gene_type:complete